MQIRHGALFLQFSICWGTCSICDKPKQIKKSTRNITDVPLQFSVSVLHICNISMYGAFKNKIHHSVKKGSSGDRTHDLLFTRQAL